MMKLLSSIRLAILLALVHVAPARADLPPRPEIITALFVSLSDALIVSTSFGHHYLSTNDGESWKLGDAAAVPEVYTTFEGKQYRCRSKSIDESADDGRTWRQAGTLPGKAMLCRVLAHAGDVLFAGTLQGVYTSQDNGRTWASTPGPIQRAVINTIFFDSFQNMYVSARIDTPSETSVNYRRLQANSKWERIGFNISRPSRPHQGSLPTGENFAPHLIGIVGDRLYASSHAGLIRSRDGGKQWEEFDAGLPDPVQAHNLEPLDVVLAVCGNSKGVLYAATMRHVYRFSVAENRWKMVPIGRPS